MAKRITRPVLDIKISEGNTKIGKILNMNLPPIITCEKSIHLPCAGKCYANKFYKMRPAVKNAWDTNLRILKENPNKYFEDIMKMIDYKTKKGAAEFFRWHSSGDIYNQNYLENMVEVAIAYPKTTFLAFTKKISIDYSKVDIPSNLVIRESMWNGLEAKTNFTKAWFHDPKDLDIRIPSNTFACPGKCKDCHFCWTCPDKDVQFKKH